MVEFEFVDPPAAAVEFEPVLLDSERPENVQVITSEAGCDGTIACHAEWLCE